MELDDRMFQEVMEAINRGDRGRARDLLTRLIKEDPEKADYWLWMSAVVESVQERVYCLKEVQKLDPQNNIVRRGLILAGALPVDEKMVVPYEMQRRKWQVRLEKPVALHTPWKQIFLFSAVCLLLLGLGGWVFYSIRNNAAAAPVRPTRIYIPSTETTTPSPAVKASSNPTNSLPTPLWMLLPATYTPTPLYVNTPHPRTEAYRTALRAYQRGDYQAMLEYLNQAGVIDQKSEDIFYYKGDEIGRAHV
jgi:hypothetical protein